MLVLLALVGDEEKAGYSTVTGVARVNAADGTNSFSEFSCGMHKYVVKKKENDYYKNMINDYLN